MPNIDNILKQLKSRKVFRSLAIYAGFAFVLLQVCDIVIPRLFLPEWTMTFIIVLTIIGFPIIAILSWIYDITPAEDGETPPTEATQPLGVYALTGLVLTVIGIGFWVAVGVFGLSFGGDDEVPSIGILMMDNIGGEDDEFWARGITEDLIIKVASAGLIRVPTMEEIIGVSSISNYNSIAKELRVKYLLTSSIHKKESGFDLRCQLIEVESGVSKYANKWSEPLKNSPRIVGNLADDILKILKISSKQDITAVPTHNTEAYEYYLKGLYRLQKTENIEDKEIARGLLEKAIELDDNLIYAKGILGFSYKISGNYNKAMKILLPAIKQAEKLDEKCALGQLLYFIGRVYYQKGDYYKSLDVSNRSLKIFEEINDKGESNDSTENNIVKNISGYHGHEQGPKQAI